MNKETEGRADSSVPTSEQNNGGVFREEPIDVEVEVEPPKEETAPAAPTVDELLAVPLEQHQRLLADFDNYRKRVERENARLSKWIAGELIGRLLPILDDFERAETACPPDSMTFDRTGILIIRDRLAEVLRKEGLREIEAAQGDRFDPEIHEAVLAVPSEEVAEGRLTALLQKGYFFGDRLLRPAKVAVSRGPAEASSAEEVGE